MLNKKHLKKIDKTIFLLKNIGVLRFVPLIFLDVITPLLILICALYGENMTDNLLTIVNYIFPINSVWFSLFVIKEFIESEGREIYYILGKVNILKESFNFFLILYFNIVFLLIIICILMPEFVFEIIRITAACLFYFAIIYFVSMISKSTSIALFFVIIYTLINVIFKTHEIKFLIYSTVNLINKVELFKISIPLLTVSIIMIIIGKIFEKKNKIID